MYYCKHNKIFQMFALILEIFPVIPNKFQENKYKFWAGLYAVAVIYV
jgi:hypothetical protein